MATVTFNVNLSLGKESNFSVLMLANLEALAGENEFEAICPNPASRYGSCRKLVHEINQIGLAVIKWDCWCAKSEVLSDTCQPFMECS